MTQENLLLREDGYPHLPEVDVTQESVALQDSIISVYDIEKVKQLKYDFIEKMIHAGVQYRTCGAISSVLNDLIQRNTNPTNLDADALRKENELLRNQVIANEKRWSFLHSINRDADGYEWEVLRVKRNADSSIAEALQTLSDLSDLDAALKGGAA